MFEILPDKKTYLASAFTIALAILWTAARFAPVVLGWTVEPWISQEVYVAGLGILGLGGGSAQIAALRNGVEKSKPLTYKRGQF